MKCKCCNKPIAFIDLFSGGGGSAEGAIQAGAIVPVAFDCWVEANAVHQANHPNTKVIHRMLGKDAWADVHLISTWIEIYRARGYHIHIHGSPPCQALSQASKTNADEGMTLGNYYLDLVTKYTDPDSWSMENVVPVAKRLPDHINFVKLNSADFGIAQTRIRVFAGEGWNAEPSHSKDQWLGVIEVLPHLKEEMITHIDGQRSRGSYSGSIDVKTGKRKWRDLAPLRREVKEPCYTVMTNARPLLNIKLEALGANANRGQDRTIIEPSKTICGSGNQVGSRIFDHSKIKATKIRSLTIQETAVIQGFPIDYDFEPAGTQKARWTIIGNAVVPGVMKAIIEGVGK